MDEIKEIIKKELYKEIELKGVRKNSPLNGLIDENKAVCDSLADELTNRINGLVGIYKEALSEEVTTNINKSPMYNYYQCQKWVDNGVSWNDIAEAMCLYGKQRVELAKRKLKPFGGRYVNDIDAQRLRKLGIKIKHKHSVKFV